MNKEKEKSKRKAAKKLTKTKSAFVNYSIGDFLIRLKNCVLANNREIRARSSNLIESTAKVLMKEGYLKEVKNENGEIVARLAFQRKEPVILGIRLISSPGLRVYKRAVELEKEKGPSVFIVTTPEGVMTSREAIKKRLGGEVIAEIW